MSTINPGDSKEKAEAPRPIMATHRQTAAAGTFLQKAQEHEIPENYKPFVSTVRKIILKKLNLSEDTDITKLDLIITLTNNLRLSKDGLVSASGSLFWKGKHLDFGNFNPGDVAALANFEDARAPYEHDFYPPDAVEQELALQCLQSGANLQGNDARILQYIKTSIEDNITEVQEIRTILQRSNSTAQTFDPKRITFLSTGPDDKYYVGYQLDEKNPTTGEPIIIVSTPLSNLEVNKLAEAFILNHPRETLTAKTNGGALVNKKTSQYLQAKDIIAGAHKTEMLEALTRAKAQGSYVEMSDTAKPTQSPSSSPNAATDNISTIATAIPVSPAIPVPEPAKPTVSVTSSDADNKSVADRGDRKFMQETVSQTALPPLDPKQRHVMAMVMQQGLIEELGKEINDLKSELKNRIKAELIIKNKNDPDNVRVVGRCKIAITPLPLDDNPNLYKLAYINEGSPEPQLRTAVITVTRDEIEKLTTAYLKAFPRSVAKFEFTPQREKAEMDLLRMVGLDAPPAPPPPVPPVLYGLETVKKQSTKPEEPPTSEGPKPNDPSSTKRSGLS